jgi:cell pole-organizing protein PopZ
MDELTLADGTNTDEIIVAIRRIMATDEEVLTDEEGTGSFSKEARERIFTALDRLTSSEKKPPTLLEALVLEWLDPVLQDWLDRNLPPLVECLMREEIRGLVETAVSSTAPSNDTKEDTPPEMAIEDAP